MNVSLILESTIVKGLLEIVNKCRSSLYLDITIELH